MDWIQLPESILFTDKQYLALMPDGCLYKYVGTLEESIISARKHGLSAHFVRVDMMHNQWINVSLLSQTLPFVINELYQAIDYKKAQNLLEEPVILDNTDTLIKKHQIPDTNFIHPGAWLDDAGGMLDLALKPDWFANLVVFTLSFPDAKLVFISTREIFFEQLSEFYKEKEEHDYYSVVSPFINAYVSQDYSTHEILTNQLSAEKYASIIQLIQHSQDRPGNENDIFAHLHFPAQNPGALDKHPSIQALEEMIAFAMEINHTSYCHSYLEALFTHEIDIKLLSDSKEKEALIQLLNLYAISQQHKGMEAWQEEKANYIAQALASFDLGLSLCETAEQSADLIYNKAICLLVKIGADNTGSIPLQFLNSPYGMLYLPQKLEQDDLKLLEQSKKLFLKVLNPIQQWSGLATINLMKGVTEKNHTFIQEAIANFDECIKLASKDVNIRSAMEFNRKAALEQLERMNPIFPLSPSARLKKPKWKR